MFGKVEIQDSHLIKNNFNTTKEIFIFDIVFAIVDTFSSQLIPAQKQNINW